MNGLICFFYLVMSLVPVPEQQLQQRQPFRIYVFTARYSEGTRKYIEDHHYLSAHMLPQRMIDRDNDLNIETDSVVKYLNFLYPDRNDTGMCVIDWEGKGGKNLMLNDPGSAEFIKTEAKFLQLVKLVRDTRPYVRVGFYGLPFRVFNPSQQKYNSGNKLDRLLSKCDFIAPSLYIMYPDAQIGRGRNMDYLKQNLDNAFEYASRLNKPVIPFVWYKIHPGNKIYGNMIISKDEIERYLSFIGDYRYGKSRIDAIVWWETSIAGKNRRDREARAFSRQPRGGDNYNPDSILIQYTYPFINR